MPRGVAATIEHIEQALAEINGSTITTKSNLALAARSYLEFANKAMHDLVKAIEDGTIR
jgi:hypothetical protein